jgi:TetR/AcrR family transcriptional regulator, transcriptional repressor for nem operon
MARERQFEESEVLAAAADVFARHGFQGTSLAMLLEATGLAKQSLYNCFGDKRSLYLKALDDAVGRYGLVQRLMDQAPNGRAALTVFFDRIVSFCVSPNPADRQCVVSAGLLESIDDAAIRGDLLSKWSVSHEMLRAAVERGQKDGSITNSMPSAALADLLLSLTSGLRVTAQAEPGAARLRQTAALVLSLLDRPPPA